MEYNTKLVDSGMDVSVNEWVTVGSPIPMIAILGAYLAIVRFGPKFMENRKPMNLKPALLIYNAFQISFTLYILSLPLRNPRVLTVFSSNCKSSEIKKDEPWWGDLVYVLWCYYISKFIDLLDTIFFVLRKKSGQITFLHVWHHSVIVPSAWAFVKYLQDPAFVPLLLLNTAVHVIMYTYYLIAALGPQYARFIWWKKYMTRIQLGQFVLVITYLAVLWACQCHISKGMATYVIANNFILIGLFGNFYYNAYNTKKQKLT